ncbi:salicylate hydroxylase [Naviculisporaceae sp. PSN 640]
MKIIIVGGGISGLATYLFLRKLLPNPSSSSSSHAIYIYESHRPRNKITSNTSKNNSQSENQETSISSLSTSTQTVGGGLGVSPNGMRILHDISPALHEAVTAQGYPCEKFIFMAENGWTLGVSSSGDQGGYEAHGPDAREEVCVSSLRGGLWACLKRHVDETYGEGEEVVRYEKVAEVRPANSAEGKKAVVVFEGGREEEADLVIGADGVKSVVRRGLFGEGNFEPVYTGASGIGGVIHGPLPARVADNKAMVFTFGRQGFFGYASSGPASSESLMWWSTFDTESVPSKTTNLDPNEIKAGLQERHGNAADPVVRDIISKAEVQSIYPTWVMPDLPHWGQNGIVLVGDAAHALSPTTGQGASQALEDAQTLGLLLAETLTQAYSSEELNTESPGHAEAESPNANVHTAEPVAGKEKAALALTLKLFYEIRHGRVARIRERGRKMDRGKRKMTVVEEYAMYCFFKVMMTFMPLGEHTFPRVLPTLVVCH